MKKCASCTKDLPDAALHCVFCGAKQPPAPATAGGVAKTVLGSYQASDVIEHMKNQPRPSPGPMPAAAPYSPPRPAPAPYQPMPSPAAVAPTMFVPGSNPPGPASNMARPSAPVASPIGPTIVQGPGGAPMGPRSAPMSQPPPMGHPMGHPPMGHPPMGGPPMGGPMMGGPPMGGPPMGGPPMGGPPMGGPMMGGPPMGGPMMGGPPMAPGGPQPIMPSGPPVPMGGMHHPATQPPPFAHVNTAARIGRPIEPWKDTLRLMMFIWGGALLVVFALPTTTEPLGWSWDMIINGQGTQKLPPLIMAAVGLLSIAIAAIPTSPAPRGMFAAMLGLTGVLVPLFLPGMPPWQVLVPLGGLFVLLPGLFLRTEYRESIAPRIMITLGVLAVLSVQLVPVNDKVPLVTLFDQLINAPGKAKIGPILHVTYIALVVLTLLAWLPSPSTGAANIFAWVIIGWPVLEDLTTKIVGDQIANAITKTPGQLFTVWVALVAYSVLIGYGIATLVGKKLE